METGLLKYRYFPILLFTVAFFFGLTHQVFLVNDPLSRVLYLDQASYYNKALDIVGGKYLPDGVFFQAPLYPYFLAGIFKIFGAGNLTAVRLLQLMIGSLVPVIIYGYSRKLFGWQAAALAGVLTVFCGILVFYQGLILKVTLSLFVTVLLFAVLLNSEKLDWKRSLTAGVLFGLSCLLRGNMLLFFPFVLVYLLVKTRPKHISGIGLFTLGTLICILPVTAVNYFQGNDFVLLTAHGGPNFYIGYNPSADGKAGRPAYLRASPEYEEHDFRKYAEQETGRKMKPSEISTFWKNKAKEYIKTHPKKSVWLLWLKFRIFFNAYEVPDNKNYYFDRRFSPVLYAGFVNYGLIAPLGILGFFLLLPRIRQTFLLHAFLAVYSLSIIFFHVYSRYRIPVFAAMIPFAAYALIWFIDQLRAKHWRYVFWSLIVFLAITAFVNQNIGRYSYAQWHYNLAQAYSALDKDKQAVIELETALKISPEYGEAWNLLGKIHFGMGNADMACEEFQKAIIHGPHLAEPYLNLGTCYANIENYESAEEMFLRSLERNPDYEKAYFNLGRLYLLMGKYGKAVEMLENARSLDPSNFKTLFNLAEAYENTDIEKARTLYQKLLDILPADMDALKMRSETMEKIAGLDHKNGKLPDK